MATLPAYFAAFGIGGSELVLILLILLLLFGGSKLPSLAKGLGQSIKEFKKAQREDEPEVKAPETKVVETKAGDPKKSEPANTHGPN